MIKDFLYIILHKIKKIKQTYFSVEQPETYVLSDRNYIKKYFFKKTGKKLDLRHPKTFNEKMQWLKIYDRKPFYSVIVDKYEVKKYAEAFIGNNHIVKTFGVWDNFDDIDFEKLPDSFVLKCTHDCGSYVFCKDKKYFDYSNAENIINNCLKKNYYYHSYEWPYKNVKPRIIAEEFLQDLNSPDNSIPNEFQFWCFNGKPVFLSAIFQPHGENLKASYDTEWNRLPFVTSLPEYPHEIAKPSYFDEMKDCAKKLCKDQPFVRVDFMTSNDNFYLGELTKFPASGIVKWFPDEWNIKLGNLLKL